MSSCVSFNSLMARCQVTRLLEEVMMLLTPFSVKLVLGSTSLVPSSWPTTLPVAITPVNSFNLIPSPYLPMLCSFFLLELIICYLFVSVGKEIVDLCLDRIRKLADNCTGLQGFLEIGRAHV